MSVLLDAYVCVCMSQKRRRTAMMTNFPLKHTSRIYVRRDNIETGKRSFVTFRFSLYYLLYRRHCGRNSHSILFMYNSISLAHAHTRAPSCSSIYIRRNVPRITHPRAFLRRIKHSQAKCTCSTRCIDNHALKAPSGDESIIEEYIGKVNLILKYATWVYPRQR